MRFHATLKLLERRSRWINWKNDTLQLEWPDILTMEKHNEPQR